MRAEPGDGPLRAVVAHIRLELHPSRAEHLEGVAQQQELGLGVDVARPRPRACRRWSRSRAGRPRRTPRGRWTCRPPCRRRPGQRARRDAPPRAGGRAAATARGGGRGLGVPRPAGHVSPHRVVVQRREQLCGVAVPGRPGRARRTRPRRTTPAAGGHVISGHGASTGRESRARERTALAAAPVPTGRTGVMGTVMCCVSLSAGRARLARRRPLCRPGPRPRVGTVRAMDQMVDPTEVARQYRTESRLDTRRSVWRDSADGRNPQDAAARRCRRGAAFGARSGLRDRRIRGAGDEREPAGRGAGDRPVRRASSS